MKKILLVDDLGIDVLLTRLAIEECRFEHQLVIAHDGEEALALVAAERFDLMLLDIKMPKVDGFEFLARLRDSAEPGAPALAAIIVSGSGSGLAADRERARQLGALGYIQKAVDYSVFKAELKSALKHQGMF